MEIDDPIGRRVRALRYQHALSQIDLAARAGVDRFTILRLERGSPVRPSTIRKVARALGVQPTAITIGARP